MTARILVIEDDIELGAQIVERLAAAKFAPTLWREGRVPDRETLSKLDLVVLDLMLPVVYGLDILKAVRTHSDVPVLVLSARNDTSDKVRALKLGADDYMTKPFWPEELVERVRARLRRPKLARATAITIGALHINLANREVFVDGVEVQLTKVEFDFLAALAERPGQAMTRAWLFDKALARDGDGGERTLDVHVSRLRKKLGSRAFVETVWGIGYRLTTGREP